MWFLYFTWFRKWHLCVLASWHHSSRLAEIGVHRTFTLEKSSKPPNCKADICKHVVVLLAHPKTKDGEKEAVFKAGKGRWSHLDGDVGGEQSLLGAPPPLPFFFFSGPQSLPPPPRNKSKTNWVLLRLGIILAGQWSKPSRYGPRRGVTGVASPQPPFVAVAGCANVSCCSVVVGVRVWFFFAAVSCWTGLDFLAGRLFFCTGGWFYVTRLCVCVKKGFSGGL